MHELLGISSCVNGKPLKKRQDVQFSFRCNILHVVRITQVISDSVTLDAASNHLALQVMKSLPCPSSSSLDTCLSMSMVDPT